ncbi:hypothetical protein BDW59DRAFT_161460 [Aspergillus cavernicola]|uniref:Uncharacterized protein n=1 Tax=Aspergillus cavernicola TaxID=176166 RepID=A0ABR4IDH3_9EURO
MCSYFIPRFRPWSFPGRLVKTPVLPPSLDLAGQTGIITGGYTGLGYKSADNLLSHNLSRLIITVPDWKVAREATANLANLHPHANIEVWFLDMLCYTSIQHFIWKCDTILDRIDFVILSAGILSDNFIINTSTNHETTFQVNYLSTVLLTILLLPVLKSKNIPNKPARITLIGSSLALSAKFPEQRSNTLISAFDNKGYWEIADRYSTTKLLLLMFIVKLKSYVDSDEVVVNVVNPGLMQNEGLDQWVIKTNFGDEVGPMANELKIEPGASTFHDAACLKLKTTTHGTWLSSWGVHP